MEEKLREFKSRRKREMLLNKPTEIFRGIVEAISPKKNVPSDSNELQNPLLTEKCTPEYSRVVDDDEASTISVCSSTDTSLSLVSMSWYTIAIQLLYFLLWVITYLIAIQLEFGFVYLVLSGLFFIYFNTRTGPKKKGEISAYSVFNPGCEAIDGTLKAEHLEREFNLIQHKTSP